MSIVSLLATGAPHRLITDERFASSIDDRLDPEADPVVNRVFSNYAPTASGESVYEANLWGDAWSGGTLDFTGINWWNDQNGSARPHTAVSPRHVIGARHVGIANGTTIRFIAADGTFVDREVIDQYTNASTDLLIAYLDEDLPETIAKYPIFDGDLYGRISLTGYPILTLYPNGTYRALADIHEGHQWPEDGSCRVPLDNTRFLYHIEQDAGSGLPGFAVLGTQLIFLFALFTAGGDEQGEAGPSGPSVLKYFDEVMAACETLDDDNDQTGHLPLIFDA